MFRNFTLRPPRYQLYIASQLSMVTLVVTLSLTSIVWLLQALKFIDYIVNRGVSVWTFLQLTSMLLPSLLVMIVPVAVMAAAVFVYARLTQDSELVVLLSAGISRMQLARPLMWVGGAMVCLLYLLSLYVLPKSYGEFKEMQSFLKDNYAALLLQEEVFNSPVEGLTVYIHERNENGTLKGVLVHDNRRADKPVTMMAKTATLTQTPTGPRFILEQGNRQEITDGKLSLLYFSRYPLDVTFMAGNTKDRLRKPEEIPMSELIAEARGQIVSDDHRKRLAELHHRVTWPILALSMGLLSLGILLRGEFNRRGSSKRVTISVVMGTLPLLLAIMLENAASNVLGFIGMMYLNVFLCGIVGWIALTDWKMPTFLVRLNRPRTAGAVQ